MSSKNANALLIVSLILIVLWMVAHLVLRRPRSEPVVVIGHRGAAGLAPENTLAGIEAGIAHGVDAVEVDVHRSADDVLVVIHDGLVGRTTNGTGAVRDQTWDELSQLDAGSHFSPDFSGEPIPRLDDVLMRLKAEEVTLYLEVKEPWRYESIEQDIVDALVRHDMQTQTVVMSFDHGWLQEFHALAPDIPVFSLGVGMTRAPLSGEETAVGVQWRSVLIDPTLIWRMHRQGIEVSVWTVNRAWQMRVLRWLGVDAITTDRPDIAAAKLR